MKNYVISSKTDNVHKKHIVDQIEGEKIPFNLFDTIASFRLKRWDFVFYTEKIVDEETLAISPQKLKIINKLR